MARFSFGHNWSAFVANHLTDERLARAEDSLTDFFGFSDFSGLTFVDVGCGSGIFSYAAHNLGADEVVSFDVDTDVVAAAERVRSHAGEPRNWTVSRGDVLDDAFVSGLGTFDLVYSWGVLHNTGDMYGAIENTIQLVAPNGRFYLAVPNDGSKAGLSAETWVKIMHVYNRAPDIGKRLIEAWYVLGFLVTNALRGENPIEKIRNYEERRGMAFYPDVRDWLGAIPYEYAGEEAVIEFVTERSDLSLERLRTAEERENTSGTGCNEFLFRRVDVRGDPS